MNTTIYKRLFQPENKEQTKALVKTLTTDPKQRKHLIAECERIFPLVSDLIKEIQAQEVQMTTPASIYGVTVTPDQLVGHKCKPLIWQLSDVHFGRFNLLENNPRELAAILVSLEVQFSGWKPDIIVVSGDLTSIASKEEFNRFVEFAKTLSEKLWGELKPQRFLVIPGNHDTAWSADGTADKLKLFRETFVDQKVFLTPFGPATESYEKGAVQVARFNSSSDLIPPLMLVEYKEFDLEILLVVSSFFSGLVPEEIRAHLTADKLTDKELVSLLRSDTGELAREYILMIEGLPQTKSTRVAFTHHHLCTFGSIPCHTRHASFVLQTLPRKQCHLVFHGHVHLVEDHTPARLPVAGLAFAIPCPTLTSHSVTGGNGIAVHAFGEYGPQRMVSTIIWGLTTAISFEPETCRLRYQNEISPTGLVSKLSR